MNDILDLFLKEPKLFEINKNSILNGDVKK